MMDTISSMTDNRQRYKDSFILREGDKKWVV